MNLTSHCLIDGERIPDAFAFCNPAHDGHVCLGQNLNPHLRWDDAPADTRSFALICHDIDAPSSKENVNQEGRQIAVELPRNTFFHWLLFDLPSTQREIRQGQFSSEVTPGGKPGPETPCGARQGINDYGLFLTDDESMRGDYYGYDGPCPPWNDLRVHRYIFTLYALRIERLPLSKRVDGNTLLQAIKGQVLAQAQLCGTYSLNPALLQP